MLLSKVQNQIRTLSTKPSRVDIDSKVKGQSARIKVRSYGCYLWECIRHSFQTESSASSPTVSRPKRTARAKPISMADLDSEDSNDSDLDDDDLKAIAEAKVAFNLRNDLFDWYFSEDWFSLANCLKHSIWNMFTVRFIHTRNPWYTPTTIHEQARTIK